MLTAVSPAALILVALLMATIAVAVGTAPPASAAEAPPLAPLLNTALLVGGTPAGTQSEGLFAATQAQRASLANLEAQAVDATVLDHALDVPGTSAADTAAAARTWGRDAAEIELWGLIVRAIKTPAASRTTDQANVVDWLQAVVARERATEIRDAALEYVKWAGLGASNYASLLASNPSESALKSFLSQDPNNYGAGFSEKSPKSTSNEGYCVYESPTKDEGAVYEENIYHGVFSNSASPTCYQPCPTPLGCDPKPPPIANFIEWGLFDSLEPLLTQQSTSNAILGMSKQFDFAAAARLGAELPGGPAAGPAFDPNSLAGAELGALKTFSYPVEMPAGVSVGLDVAEKLIGLISTFVDEVPGVGEAAAAVSVAIEIYNFSVSAAVPGQLAQAITQTQPTPDLAAMLKNEGGLLLGLFAAATGPTPQLEKQLDNQLPSCDVDPGLDASATPCLNPPSPLDQSGAMALTVTPKGQSGAFASTVAWTDNAAKIDNRAYFVGDWAVDTATTPQGTATYQTLDINYTDWSGKEQTAWLVPSSSGGFQFLTAQVTADKFDPSTCAGSGLCTLTPSIQMVDPDGKDFTLSVNVGNGVPALPPDNNCGGICLGPELTETASPTAGEVGQPITLTARSPVTVLIGTVSFVEDVGGKDTTLCKDVPVPPESDSVSCSWTPTAPVDDAQIYATFAPSNPTHDGFGSDQASVSVQVSAKAPTTTTLTASAPTVPLGAAITYTAAVADFYPGDTAVPGGTVDFWSDTGSEGAETDLCTDVPLVAGPDGLTATCPATLRGAGTQTVVATYVGDAATGSSTGSTQTTVPPRPTVIKVDAASGLTLGKQTPITVRLSAAGVPSSAFTGTIEMRSPDGARCQARVADGLATCQYTPVSAGSVTLSVDYESPMVVTFPPPRISYGALSGQTTVTATVERAPLTITASSVQRRYGDTLPTIAASYSGFVNGDTPASLSTAPNCTTTASDGSPVATYSTSCSGASDPDYAITYVDGSVTLTAAPLAITASSPSSTYGSTPPAITAGYSGFVNGDTPADLSSQPSCTTAVTRDAPAGTYPSSCSGAADHNYDITYVDGTVTVGPAPLQITASDAVMEFGTAPPTITPSYQGFVNGDTPAGLANQPACTTTAKSSSPPGKYPSTCSGATGSNYAITYADGTVTVNRAATSLTTSSNIKTKSFTATLTRTNNSTPIAGQPVTFSGEGTTPLCTATTNAAGVASCTGTSTSIKYITQGYAASYAGNATLAPSTATGGQTPPQ